jgi:acyl-CoA synthetase (AMP-forming)/AMP-acid ligase II
MVLDETQVYLPELWATYASSQPAKTAVICGSRRQTWRELNESWNRIANRLRAAGVGRGDKVAVLMNNSIETLHAMFGVVKAGACVVPISTLLTPEQVATLLEDSESVGLFVSDPTRATADAALRTNAVLRKDLRIVVGMAVPGWTTLDTWLGDAPATEPDVRYAMEDEFNIIYSSGTTGLPKGIVQTHRARQHWSYSNALEMRFDDTAVALTTTSLYSNGTMFMVLPPLFVGGTIVIMPSFSAEAFFEAVAREGVTHTFMVPTQIGALLESPALESANLRSLRTIVSAGSPLRDEVKLQAQRRLCRGLFELYGFTEGFATIIKPEDLERKPGSVGKPVVGFELRILSDDGRELPAGEIGEIAGYGGGLMKQYYRKPEATREATWRDSRGRTFVRSGDIGRIDADGFLYILDRKKDMILSGGFNVFPKDIEEVVARHPDVADVTVIGVPHAKWGETPLALVIPKPGRALDAAAVRDWANERLSKTQRLSGVEVRSEFPRNALGKVLKRVLREPYWSAKSA